MKYYLFFFFLRKKNKEKNNNTFWVWANRWTKKVNVTWAFLFISNALKEIILKITKKKKKNCKLTFHGASP